MPPDQPAPIMDIPPVTVKVLDQALNVTVEGPADRLMTLKMLHNACGAILDAMAKERLQAGRKIATAGAGLLHALPPVNGKGD